MDYEPSRCQGISSGSPHPVLAYLEKDPARSLPLGAPPAPPRLAADACRAEAATGIGAAEGGVWGGGETSVG